MLNAIMLPFCSHNMLRWRRAKTQVLEGLQIAKRHCDTGLDNHCRDGDGEIRHKRSDTLVGTLREAYGSDFAKRYRSDAQLGTVLKGENAKTLSELLKRR